MIRELFDRLYRQYSTRREFEAQDWFALSAQLEEFERTQQLIKGMLTGGSLRVNLLEADDWIVPNLQAGVVLRRETNQTISNPDNVDYTIVEHDTHGYADLTANSERITIPPGMGGLYVAGNTAAASSPSSFILYLKAVRDSVENNLAIVKGNTTLNRLNSMSAAYMNEGDYFYTKIETPSVTLVATSTDPSILWAVRVIANNKGAK